MKILRYLLFLIFNHYYKDGKCKENDMPYFSATLAVVMYEGVLFILVTFFLDRYISLPLVSSILKPLDYIVYGHAILAFAWMYPINHYFFIKKKYLDSIYNEFTDAKINTQKNRIIGYTCLILYWPIVIGIGGHLKYWFP